MDDTRAYYRLTVAQVLRLLETSKTGLTTKEALERQVVHSANTLSATDDVSSFWHFLAHSKHPLVLAPLIAALLLVVIGELGLAGALIGIALISTALLYLYNHREKQQTQAVHEVRAETAYVMRDGKKQRIPATELVPGDIVFLDQSGIIPADIRLLRAEALVTDERLLTGVPTLVEKNIEPIKQSVPLQHHSNMIFLGTKIVAGTGYGVVTATGSDSLLGICIAQDITDSTPPSTGAQTISNLHMKTWRVIGIGWLIIILSMLLSQTLTVQDGTLFAAAWLIAITPFGFLLVRSDISMGTIHKLARRHAFVRRLTTIEKLSSSRLIVLDSMEPFLHNEAAVESFIIGRERYVAGSKTLAAKIKKRRSELELFFAASVLSGAHENDTNPVEHSISTLAHAANIDPAELSVVHPLKKRFTYTAARGYGASIRHYKIGSQDRLYMFARGAATDILAATHDIWDHGHTRKLTSADKTYLTKKIHEHTAAGKHVFGVAYKTLPKNSTVTALKASDIEQKLTWLGLLVIDRPIRTESLAAYEAATRAHVAIACTSTFATAQEKVLLERLELNPPATIMTEHDIKKAQERGTTVIVYGDRATAISLLRQADVGITSTDTSSLVRQEADVWLQNGTFALLTQAILEARHSLVSTRQALLGSYALSASLATLIACSFVGVLWLDIPVALSISHLVLLVIIVSLLPLAALMYDNVAQRTLRGRLSLLEPRALPETIVSGIAIGVLAWTNYLLVYTRHNAPADIIPGGTSLHITAMSVTVLSVLLCILVFIAYGRSPYGLWARWQVHNYRFWLSAIAAIALLALLMYVVVFADQFQLAALGISDWILPLFTALLYAGMLEFYRYDKQHQRHALHSLHNASQKH